MCSFQSKRPPVGGTPHRPLTTSVHARATETVLAHSYPSSAQSKHPASRDARGLGCVGRMWSDPNRGWCPRSATTAVQDPWFWGAKHSHPAAYRHQVWRHESASSTERRSRQSLRRRAPSGHEVPQAVSSPCPRGRHLQSSRPVTASRTTAQQLCPTPVKWFPRFRSLCPRRGGR